MYRHILVPTDGSALANRAIKTGIALAKALGAKLTAVYAVPVYVAQVDVIFPAFPVPTRDEYERQAASEAELIFKEVVDACAAADVEYALVHAFDDHPYRLIPHRKSACLRSDLHVLARAPRHQRLDPGQRNAKGPDPWRVARTGRALRSKH